MLKKEKKRAPEAAQLVIVSNGQKPSAQSASPLPLSPDWSMVSRDHRGRAIQSMKTGPWMSLGKQEAFEIFIKDHEDHLTIEDNKSLLKQRAAEARTLGAQMIEARNRINELKKQLVMQRRQRAAYGVMGNHTEAAEEVVPVEENLCRHIEQEKKTYKSTVGRLKALRTEIEHLQLLLERTKVKIQKDFQKLWSQEAFSVHEESESETTARCNSGLPSGTLQPSSPGTPRFHTPSESSTVKDSSSGPDSTCSTASGQDLRTFIPNSVPPMTAAPAWQKGRVMERSSASEWRALSTTSLSSSSIPLTGDQQADTDILAFVRARQKLLHRTGPPH